MELVKEKIEEKEGKIIKESFDVFEPFVLECKNSHSFSLYSNDILSGKWCQKCTDIVIQILTQLQIDFEKNKKIGNLEYPYVITGKRNFVFITSEKEKQNQIDNAKKNNYHIIVLLDFNISELQEKIWDSIRENIEYIELKKESEKSSKEHSCHLTEELGNEKEDESGSLIKYAPEPYPTYMKHIVGYVRVSTSMQVQDGFSLENQEAKILNETNKLNGFLKSIYIDRGISGGSMEKRLALEKLLSNLKKGDWVIVNSVSRLARKTKDLLSIVEDIENKGCHLIIIDLNLDITSPSGKLILTLMGSQAQFEREITSERVKGVMQHLKNTGNLKTKPPFGMKMNPDKSTGAAIHVRDEEEQKIIEQIRIQRRKFPSIPITSLSEVLNKEKISPPRKSKKWYHKTLKVIMEREGIT
jgi:DNA invertase Pin-like site-specific DNA recombinase